MLQNNTTYQQLSCFSKNASEQQNTTWRCEDWWSSSHSSVRVSFLCSLNVTRQETQHLWGLIDIFHLLQTNNHSNWENWNKKQMSENRSKLTLKWCNAEKMNTQSKTSQWSCSRVWMGPVWTLLRCIYRVKQSKIQRLWKRTMMCSFRPLNTGPSHRWVNDVTEWMTDELIESVDGSESKKRLLNYSFCCEKMRADLKRAVFWMEFGLCLTPKSLYFLSLVRLVSGLPFMFYSVTL